MLKRTELYASKIMDQSRYSFVVKEGVYRKIFLRRSIFIQGEWFCIGGINPKKRKKFLFMGH